MNRYNLFVLAMVALFAFAGCRAQDGDRGIARNLTGTANLQPSGPPAVVDLVELAQVPDAYVGSFVQISGRYAPPDLLVCDEVTRPSPATWSLTEGQLRVGARGLENLLRPLVPPGLTLTVEGVWNLWRGPVGCGKNASVRDVYYLQVTDIVVPSPVARVTLTPVGAVAATTDAGGAGPFTATPTIPGPPALGTPVTMPTATLPGGTGTTATASATRPTATATSSAGSTPTVAATNATATPATTAAATATTATATTATSTPQTATATATVSSGVTPTLTPTSPPVTPSATPARTTVDQGEIGFQDLQGRRLGNNELHTWSFTVEAGDVITISVAARKDSNIALTVLDEDGHTVLQQNNAPAGSVERIEGFVPDADGVYELRIGEGEGRETYYAMLILNNNFDNYYPFLFVGILSYAENRTINLAASTDHFWQFYGQANETISVNISPNDQGDLFYELWDPEGFPLLEFVNDTGPGQAEQLLNFQLPQTGMYSFRVGELSYLPSNYTIYVTQN